MKAKLYKVLDQYHLYDGDKAIATTIVGNPMLLPNLSKQNCDEIFGVVDVEKLAKEKTRKYLPGCPENIMNFIAHERFFKIAFNKAMELNKDKVFTLEDMRMAYDKGRYSDKVTQNGKDIEFNSFIQSLQQPTEIDVEIEMEEKSYSYLVTIGEVKTTRLEPKLDSEGCLILKRIV